MARVARPSSITIEGFLAFALLTSGGRMKMKSRAAMLATVLFLGGLANCDFKPDGGVGGSVSCTDAPFKCAESETCWIDEHANDFICLEGKEGKMAGDDCTFIGGQVSCGPGQVCLGKGSCRIYCDPND